MEITFIGIGTLGRGMVRNLLGAGHRVTLWNRTERALPPELAEARRAATLAEAVQGAKVILLCVTGPDAQREIFQGPDGLLAHLTPGSLVADATTTAPELSVELAGAVAALGASYLDTPVFGSKNEAWEGRLDFVCGGSTEAFERLRPLLEPLAATVHHMGGPGAGSSMKLIGNLLVAAQMASLGEALALARKAGLDGGAVMGVLDVADYSSALIRGVGRATLAGNYEPSFFLRHMLKDAHLIADFARRLEVPLPASAPIVPLYQAALNQGLGDLNASALHQLLFAGAGLPQQAK
jgi:3-hydroxyisobutyrate dehydrogenase-like beta-hydroxyacid dehydrogenase